MNEKEFIRECIDALQAQNVFHTPLALSRKKNREWDEYETDAIKRQKKCLALANLFNK